MNQISIAVIDGHPVAREGYIAILHRETDFKVIAEGNSVHDIVPLVERYKPDVVLLNTQMGQSTLGFVSRIKGAHPVAKVLFVSSDDSEQSAKQGSLLGGSGAISKQDAAPVICTAIRRVAANMSFFSDHITPAKGKGRKAPRHSLSPREVEILCCVAHCLTVKEVAKSLNVSTTTIDRHKSHIMQKIKARSQMGLVRYAILNGFVDP